jgi:DNA topoisomerase-1
MDAEASAAAARLRHVTDAVPGMRRERRRGGFRYIRPDGRPVHDLPTLGRIKRLAIPPAWTDVWICADPHGHVQAVGRDAKGRKQYRYHPRWRAVRDETKYARMVAFARALPAIRSRVARDLELRGLPRERILATVVRLLDSTSMRIGNREYARNNRSFGLTTLRNRHVRLAGPGLSFEFKSKGGKLYRVDVADRRLATVVRRCQDLPGYELFQYVDADGSRQLITSTDVNAYLRDACGHDFTAKDFRTWAGTVAAARELGAAQNGSGRRRVTEAIGRVARQLGNTPAICRRSYIHPAIMDAHAAGSLSTAFEAPRSGPRRTRALAADERVTLRILERAERGGRRRTLP